MLRGTDMTILGKIIYASAKLLATFAKLSIHVIFYTVILIRTLDPTRYDLECRDIGDYAELGLWVLLGLQPGQAKALVGRRPFGKGVDLLFKALVDVLPVAKRISMR